MFQRQQMGRYVAASPPPPRCIVRNILISLLRWGTGRPLVFFRACMGNHPCSDTRTGSMLWLDMLFFRLKFRSRSIRIAMTLASPSNIGVERGRCRRFTMRPRLGGRKIITPNEVLWTSMEMGQARHAPQTIGFAHRFLHGVECLVHFWSGNRRWCAAFVIIWGLAILTGHRFSMTTRGSNGVGSHP